MAVDYAVLLSDKNQLQRSCDAAALGGAAYLKRSPDETVNTDNARAQARLIEKQNNLTQAEVDTSIITFLENNTKIRVAAKRDRSLYFARIFGILQRDVTASATAVVSPPVVERVPIAITPTSKARYQNDGLPHNFTLVTPQDTAFQTNSIGMTTFDPFAVFDLSGSQAKSATQMERQLAGDLTTPVNPQVGDQLTGMSLSLGTLAGRLKDGIGLRFQKAAQTPWLDPVTGTLPVLQPWQLVGTRVGDALGGRGAGGNPRIVTFVVIEELATAQSNHNFTIQNFATAYINSVQDSAGSLTLTATFLPPGAGGGSQVSLIE